MALREVNFSRFNPDSAASSAAGIFGFGFTPEESNVVLVPVPWEATTSYGRGAAKGPKAILEASPQLDFFDADLGELGLWRPWEFGIAMEPFDPGLKKLNKEACKLALPIIAAGGAIGKDKALAHALAKVNEMSARLNAFVHERVKKHLGDGKIAGVVGGDHSVSFGAIQAAAEAHPGLGVLHIDAHADLRHAYEGFEFSHASIMENVVRRIPGVGRIVQVGIRDYSASEYELATSHPKIACYFDHALRDSVADGKPFARLCEEIVAKLPDHVYVSFDIDGLDPALCPSTGTPVPGGLSYHQAQVLLKTLARSGKKVVAFDLNEVAPSDKGDEWDGNVGARMLYKLCGVSLHSHGARNERRPERVEELASLQDSREGVSFPGPGSASGTGGEGASSGRSSDSKVKSKDKLKLKTRVDA